MIVLLTANMDSRDASASKKELYKFDACARLTAIHGLIFFNQVYKSVLFVFVVYGL